VDWRLQRNEECRFNSYGVIKNGWSYIQNLIPNTLSRARLVPPSAGRWLWLERRHGSAGGVYSIGHSKSILLWQNSILIAEFGRVNSAIAGFNSAIAEFLLTLPRQPHRRLLTVSREIHIIRTISNYVLLRNGPGGASEAPKIISPKLSRFLVQFTTWATWLLDYGI
jgi:hypothetical protein